MKQFLIIIVLLIIAQFVNGQKNTEIYVESPDSKVKAVINLAGKRTTLTVQKNNKLALLKSPLGIVVNNKNLGEKVSLKGTPTKKTFNEKYTIYGNHSEANDNCKEVSIPLERSGITYQLLVRVYDDGIAIRYIINTKNRVRINSDNTKFLLPESAKCFWAYYSSSGENLHSISSFTEIPEDKAIRAPLTIKSEDFYLSFSEANNKSFPDLSWVKEGNTIKANFLTNPEGWEIDAGEITSPWRFVVIADNLTQLVNSDMVTNLCEAPNPELDFNWVKPGRVLWQWWSVGAPEFKDQLKWYDAAARLNWEYYLIDEGWREWQLPGKDQWQCLKEVISYGKTKGIESLVWVHSKEMRTRQEIHDYLKKVKEIGAAGIKIDFIPPGTPEIIRWYQAALEETFKLQLLCNFHGCNKPTGIRRTWPHELTRECVRANEYQITRYNRLMPLEQEEITPFTRLLAGPADYTPVIFDEKELRGYTWTHELAQAVVFLSPLTHFADAYYNYLNNPAEDILRDIPVTWNETIVLSCSEIGEVAAFARRNGNEWWVGILNGKNTTDISFNLNFLNSRATATILSDRFKEPNSFIREEKIVGNTDQINIKLNPGGGYFMRLKMFE